MYRTTAATGGSHPQHILLLETHIFPAKCQLGEEIKVSQGLAAAPVGSGFHMNLLSFYSSSISQPLGMSHGGLHLPSPAHRFRQHHLLPPSPAVPGCLDAHGDLCGVPRDGPLPMMGSTGAAARWS